MTTVLPLRIEVIMYHPLAPVSREREVGFDDANDFEYLEFINRSDIAAIDLQGRKISGGLEYTFPAITLAPGERIVVARNEKAFRFRYGQSVRLAREYGAPDGGNKLDNAGETLVLRDPRGNIIQSVIFDDGWYPQTDGAGYSLQIVDVRSPDLQLWSQAAGWQPSDAVHGTPGQAARRIGDVDRDGQFTSADLVVVFQAGEYEDDVPGNSTWEEGDWNSDFDFDFDFDSADFVLAFQTGLYEQASNTKPQVLRSKLFLTR